MDHLTELGVQMQGQLQGWSDQSSGSVALPSFEYHFLGFGLCCSLDQFLS